MTENYISDGKNCYLRLEAMYDNGYEFRMIRQNQPEMLLDFHPSGSAERALDYNVTGLASLFSLRESSVFNYLYPVLYALERLGGILRSYLLRPEGLVLRPETIFLKRNTGQFYFCYVPGQVTPLRNNLMTLVEFFMKYAEPGSESEVLLLYGLYQKGREETASLQDLAAYYREALKKPEAEEMENPFSEDDPGAMEEAGIYADLGMDPIPKKKTRLFSGRTDPAQREARGKDSQTIPEPETDANPEEKPKTITEKVVKQVKAHLFEVVVAGIVIAGALLFLMFWN